MLYTSLFKSVALVAELQLANERTKCVNLNAYTEAAAAHCANQ